MCEFCLKHGEGKKWYLQAENYSNDLLSDVRRRQFIESFTNEKTITKALARSMERNERLMKAPALIKNLVKCLVVRKMKKLHYGQVVPIEDIEKIFEFTNSIVRVSCVCRKSTVGKEKRYCYGVSLSPGGGISGLIEGLKQREEDGPRTTENEILTREEALGAFRSHEQEGLCHTVWTFVTPFIGGICNCDRSDCLAMRSTITQAVPVMFRAEYVAEADPEKCAGCRECMRLCQFGAIIYSASNRKAVIDQRWCYGCGICRSVCKTNAIRLVDRSTASVAADLW
jgi:Pyruvate/2-oxoacid:ferredoxin oxidoreductase delta subunit